MPRPPAAHQATEAVTLTQALLDRARTESGSARRWTLAVASQRLRERLDACDSELRASIAAADSGDRLVGYGPRPPAAADPADTLAAIAAGIRKLEGEIRG